MPQQSLFQPVIHYIYDALCGWCYGFSPVMQKLYENYKGRLAFNVLSGGMVPPEFAQPVAAKAGYIASAYKDVEALSGVKFGEAYLHHIFHPEESGWLEESLTPAIALCLLKAAQPQDAVPFAGAIQKLHLLEGKDLSDKETYRHLAVGAGLDGDEFIRKMGEEDWKEEAAYEAAQVKQLGITGFPAVLVQVDETKFYLIARGFTGYEELVGRLENILAEEQIDLYKN